MICFYDIKYRIWKNGMYFLIDKRVDYLELVDLIIFEHNKHGHNFEIFSIKPYYSKNKFL